MPQTLAQFDNTHANCPPWDAPVSRSRRSSPWSQPTSTTDAWRVEIEARWDSIERGTAETIAAPGIVAEIRRAVW